MFKVTLNKIDGAGRFIVHVYENSDELTEFYRLYNTEVTCGYYRCGIRSVETVFTGEGTQKSRTDTIMKMWRGHKYEWNKLHSILCMDHGWENSDSIWFADNWIDTDRIARRLDKLNKDAMNGVNVESK
jgi:hypothetical protein